MTILPNRRIEVLDVLRFFAALAVVLFHYTYKGLPHTGIRLEPLSQVTRYGGFGVDLFFVVSGFVILMSAQGRTPYQFLVSRVTRLIPAYLLAVLLTFVVVCAAGPVPLQVGWTGFLENISTLAITPVGRLLHVPLVDGVYWTLALETQFYLGIGVVLLLGAMRRIRLLLWFWLGAGLLTEVLMHVVGARLPVKLLGEALLYDWAGYFIAGGFFYLAFVGQGRRTDVLALLVCYGLCATQSWERALYTNVHEQSGFTLGGVLGVVSAIYLIFAVIAFSGRSFARLTRLAWLGQATYPLYLLHAYLGYVMLSKLHGHLPDGLAVILVTTFFILGAFLVQRFVEKPAARWIRQRMLSPQAAGRPAVAEN